MSDIINMAAVQVLLVANQEFEKQEQCIVFLDSVSTPYERTNFSDIGFENGRLINSR